MIQVRNSLVLVRLMKKDEEKVGLIVVKTDGEQFCEAEVINVGPDVISAAGGQSSTHDLKAGQRVLVQHKVVMKQMGPGGVEVTRGSKEQGLKLRETLVEGERDLYLFEQHNIMAIIAQPEEN